MFNSPLSIAFRAVLHVQPIRHAALTRLSPQGARIVETGDEWGWQFRVLGRYPMITQPHFTGSWWLVPAAYETTPLPPHAEARLDVLDRKAIKPKGVIVGHEAPRLLWTEAGTTPVPWWRRELARLLSHPLYLVLTILGLAVALPLLLDLVVRATLTLVGLLAVGLSVFGLGAVAVADPVLIVVTDDDLWIEVDRW